MCTKSTVHTITVQSIASEKEMTGIPGYNVVVNLNLP